MPELNEVAAQGTLCEPCYERGRRVPAARIVGGDWMCKWCIEGREGTPPEGPKAKKPNGNKGIRLPPPNSEIVAASDVGEMRAWGNEWTAFFVELTKLPDYSLKKCTPWPNQTPRALQEEIRRFSKRVNIPVRMWLHKRKGVVYVCAKRPNIRLTDLRKIGVEAGASASEVAA